MTTTSNPWLGQAKQAHRKQLNFLVALAITEFGLRLAGCFYLASILAWLIQKGAQELPSLAPALGGLALTWSLVAILATARLRRQQHLQTDCLARIENALHQCFSKHQQALVQRNSNYHWHQLWVNDSQHISQFLSDYVPQQKLALLAPMLVIGLTAYIHWLVAAALLLTLPLVILFMVLFGEGARKLQQQHWHALTRLGALFSDRLKALPALLMMRAHIPQQQALQAASEALNQRTQAVVGVAFLSSSTIEFVTTLIMAIIAVFSGFSLLGDIQFGPPITFSSGLQLLLVTPLLLAEFRTLARFYHQKAAAVNAAEKLSEVLSTYPLYKQNDSSTSTQSQAHSNTFTGVNWQDFKISQPQLRAPSLNLGPGQHIHIQGTSGSGKTVLFEALMGWRESSHPALPGRVVMLSQKPVIAATSVRNNLTMAAPTASDSQLLDALAAVDLTYWLINLPRGLDTAFNEIPPLSGGEAQRLSLARALLCKAEVILLDEPTAHLPTDLHWNLVSLIETQCQNLTVLWASHKPLNGDFFDACWTITAQGEINCHKEPR